jgi:hypothetical protein
MKKRMLGRLRSRKGYNFKTDLEGMVASSWTGLLRLIIDSSLYIILHVGANIAAGTTSALKVHRN